MAGLHPNQGGATVVLATAARQESAPTVDVVLLELRDAMRTRRCDPLGGAGEHGCTEVHARDGRCEPFDLRDILSRHRLVGLFGRRRLLASRTCA